MLYVGHVATMKVSNVNLGSQSWSELTEADFVVENSASKANTSKVAAEKNLLSLLEKVLHWLLLKGKTVLVLMCRWGWWWLGWDTLNPRALPWKGLWKICWPTIEKHEIIPTLLEKSSAETAAFQFFLKCSTVLLKFFLRSTNFVDNHIKRTFCSVLTSAQFSPGKSGWSVTEGTLSLDACITQISELSGLEKLLTGCCFFSKTPNFSTVVFSGFSNIFVRSQIGIFWWDCCSIGTANVF